MMFFRHLDLTTALRPALSADESLLSVQDNVGLYDGKQKIPNLQDGHVYLTSHRVCYVDKTEPRGRSVAIHLKDVERSEFYAGFLKSSPKVTLYPKPQLRSSAPPTTQLAKLGLYKNGTGYSGSLPIEGGGERSTSTGRTPKQLSDRESASPLPPAPFPNRLHARDRIAATWICPICSFSNPVPPNFDPTVANSNTVLPPCQSCGVHPPLMVVVKAALASLSGRTQTATKPTGRGGPSQTGQLSSSQLVPESAPESGVQQGRPCPRCTFINHQSIPECEMCHFTLISGGALRLQGSLQQQMSGVLRDVDPVPEFVKISFRGGGEKVFYERLKSALIQRKWLLESAPPVAKPSLSLATAHGDGRTDGSSGTGGVGAGGGPVSRAVGVASLERRGKEVQLNNQRVISTAFEDLEALMASAKEVIALAETFAAHANTAVDSAIASQSATALGLSSTSTSTSVLTSFSSTTKDMLGSNSESLYLSELARTVAEFLTDDAHGGVLKREGGIITLVDLWAVFNRARGGVELVSPADFAKAAELWEPLGLPVRLRRFRKTGLLVVQSAERTDEKTMRAILAWLRELHRDTPADPVAAVMRAGAGAGAGDEDRSTPAAPWDRALFGRGVTAQEVAHKFGWSVGVATEELEMAEENGVVCREQAPDGIRFWENWLVVKEEDILRGVGVAVGVAR